jgi:hypothetical protein
MTQLNICFKKGEKLLNLYKNKKVGFINLKGRYSSRDKSLSVNFFDSVKKSTFLGIKKVGFINLKGRYSPRDKSLSVNFFDAVKKSTFLRNKRILFHYTF